MNLIGTISKIAAAAVISCLGLLAMPLAKGPSVAIRLETGAPSAGKAAEFRASVLGAAEEFLWDFGDGTTSSERSPRKVFAVPGSYAVRLTVRGGAGSATTVQDVEVTEATTLRLLSATNPAHPFDVTIVATNPNPTGPRTEDGEAIPQNDVFGYFRFPQIVPTAPGAPLVPEVFVKILDARGIGGDFWVFWGGLTSLEYTLSVRDTVRGTVKVYHNPATGNAGCLGADTTGFATGATPTATQPGGNPTPTPTSPPQGIVREVHVGAGGGNRFVDDESGNSTTTIHVGDTVRWDWVSGFHSTTSGNCCTGDGLWDSGQHTGAVFSHTFNQVGTFPYFCSVHGLSMTGTVNVLAPGATQTAPAGTPTRTPTEVPTRGGGY